MSFIIAALLCFGHWKIPSNYMQKAWEVYRISYQQRPCPGASPGRTTTVYYFHDTTNLYFVFKCEVRGEQVKRLSLRDNIDGDEVYVYITPNRLKGTGYYFALSFTGIKEDAYSNNNGESWNKDWDGLWYSDVVYKDSFVLLGFKIPVHNFFYTDKLDWGVNFKRFIAVYEEEDSYVRFGPSGMEPISMYAELSVENIKFSTHVIRIFPSFTLRKYYDDNKYSTWIGGDIVYAPRANFFTGITVYPDYSEIESDPYTINISKYRTYYPERREFFIKDMDVFRTQKASFYSRNVGAKTSFGEVIPVKYGFKSHYSIKSMDFALLSVITDGLVSRDTLISSEVYTLGRFKVSLRNARMGFFYGEVRHDTILQSIKTVDVSYEKEHLKLKGQLSEDKSHKRLLYLKSIYEKRGFWLISEMENTNDSFSVNRISYYYPEKRISLKVRRDYWNGKYLLKNYSWGLGLERVKEYGENEWTTAGNFDMDCVFANNYELYTNIKLINDYEQGKKFLRRYVYIYYGTDFSKKIAGGINITWQSRAFDYMSMIFVRSINVLPFVQLMTEHFDLSTNYSFYLLRGIEKDTVFKYATFTLKGTIYFNRYLFVRSLISQENSADTYIINLILTWRFMPGTYLYFVINKDLNIKENSIYFKNSANALKVKMQFWL